jgi:hypothetical protein
METFSIRFNEAWGWEWIMETKNSPLKTEVQSDGRIRKWKFVEEAGKYLRVILLEDGKTVHNAFFDRDFKETKI